MTTQPHPTDELRESRLDEILLDFAMEVLKHGGVSYTEPNEWFGSTKQALHAHNKALVEDLIGEDRPLDPNATTGIDISHNLFLNGQNKLKALQRQRAAKWLGEQ